jgi:hypothetical protein
MHLVQLLLPVYDNAGKAFPATFYAQVRDELAERFGGLTAYTRAPAEGLWTNAGDQPARDDIVVLRGHGQAARSRLVEKVSRAPGAAIRAAGARGARAAVERL